MLPVVVGMAALAVDVGYMYNIRTELQRAADAIARDDRVIYSVAARYGQIAENVKHMSWFVDSVARELVE